MLLSVAAVTWYYVNRIDYYVDRNRLAGEQHDRVIRMSSAMNRYSENVAELLLLGRTELDDFSEARYSLDASLLQLEDLIRTEIRLAGTEAERGIGEQELMRVQTMRSLYKDIDTRTQRLLFLREQDRLDEAIRIFREEIEERLDTALEAEITAAIAEEEMQIRQFDRLTNRLERQLERIITVAVATAFLISAAAALMLSRSLNRPMEALNSATRAIADGDLDYRISYPGRDEFAGLAALFDLAASRLKSQRAGLLEVQSGLEQEVERRTGELEEANARLKKLDHMRMLFLADIGHELRTPLTVLRGEAEVALRAARTIPDYRETLDRVVQLTHQMSRLVEDLLFLARAEVDAIRFEMQPLHLHDILDVAVSEARILADGQETEIECVVAGGDCRINGDAGRLTQALMIVMDNALKYAEPGTAVSVGLTCGAGKAEFAISNIGPEIPAEDLPFVFSRFYRGNQASARNRGGTGLGLSIAKWIVDGHGGRIDIVSADHRTTVRISLPLIS
jgi:two-component system OmpR family sensor kinase